MLKSWSLLLLGFLELAEITLTLTLTNGFCEKSISVKYQVPVTKLRYSSDLHSTEQYVDYEERVRRDTIQICCPGYSSLIFGFCQPICEQPCPLNSHCVAPNKCGCIRGYEPSHLITNHKRESPHQHHQQHHHEHHQKNHNHHHHDHNAHLMCRPICQGGCPLHAHCVGYNKCECRSGYRDSSVWFRSLRCERIQCGSNQRYDFIKKECIKIATSVEQLMHQVGEKLAEGMEEESSQQSTASWESYETTAEQKY